MSSAKPLDETRIIELYMAGNEAEAAVILAALSTHGITGRIVNDRTGEVGVNAFPVVWIREADAATAREIIQGLRDGRGDRNGLDDAGDADESCIAR